MQEGGCFIMAKRIRIILILVSMCIIGLVIFKIVRVNAQFKDIKQSLSDYCI